MLELLKIKKDYPAGDGVVHALRGIDIRFRRSEFVSILGPSGCGKTTLLNIVGGLDGYTSGDLRINGISTREYNDRDWDSYRNHSVGFVFQSYNLIPHQTVLVNVELALTLAGVSKAERRERAAAALARVGLGDQLHKKPSEMSGGQMQRVAIARALVNNPDIILADEPTGALDTETSVQVMDILKEVARERLVVMVTHNPELAEKYSSRIIRMVDGHIVSDSMPVGDEEYSAEMARLAAARQEEDEAYEALCREKGKRVRRKKERKPSMSFRTSFMLSLKNLFTKKARTILTSFAGSIGIIGIALILAVSEGVSGFIAQVQEDTLSTYPLTVQRYTQDMSAMLAAMTDVSDTEDYRDSGKIHVDDSLGTMMAAMNSVKENNLEAFKAYVEENRDALDQYLSDIQYTYGYDLQIYTSDGNIKVGMETLFAHMGNAFSGMSDMMAMAGGMSVFSEMIDNDGLLNQQYDVIAGEWPTEKNEVILVVNSNNQISKTTLYMLGVLDPNDIDEEMKQLMGGTYDPEDIPPYEYSDFIGMTFKMLTTAEFFKQGSTDADKYEVDGKTYYKWYDQRENPAFDQAKFVKENGLELKISGIVRPKEGTAATSISGICGYTRALTDYILEKNEASPVILQQKETPSVNVLTGLKFERTHYTPENIGELIDKIDGATMEVFYAYMTEQILTNPDFSDRINVHDSESFLGVYMLLPEENQAEILSAVIAAARANPDNTDAINTLFTMISMGTGGITVTPDNFPRLLPVLDQKLVLGALMGIPATPPYVPATVGLLTLAGEAAMAPIYTEMTESVMKMQVNEEIFVTILSTMTADDPAFIQLEETLYGMAPQIDATYESVLSTLDVTERAFPESINFFAKDFASKEYIESFIADYNAAASEEDRLEYSDLVGALMSSVTIIVDAITYVLIAFVAISLIVSSIMIGVITLISVQERTKEIGILRAIGASKKDVSSLFNAETMIVGFASGLVGVLVTYILCIPINLILRALTDIEGLRAVLPIGAALILIGISVLLTLIAGVIPSGSAAKKDPVVALRTE